MAVTADDIRYYLSQGRPENDTSASGGAIDLQWRLLLRAYADIGGSGSKVKVVSSSAGDNTQKLTVSGYDATDAWASEEITLNGTTEVETTTVFRYVVKVALNATCAGTVSVKQSTTGNTMHNIRPGELGAQRLFLGARANASGGGEKVLYEKVFIRNDHATDGLQQALAYLHQDAMSELKFDCELDPTSGAQITGGTQAVANRLTAPTAGGSGYQWGDHSSRGEAHDLGDNGDGVLAAGEAQGVWIQLTLPAGRSATLATNWGLTTEGQAVV
jgi:hypothetical protein